MTIQKLKYSKEEFAKRGKALYEEKVRPLLENGSEGRIVAIDIETGNFEIAETSLAASDRLRERYPEVQAWFVRIGHKTVHRIGSTNSSITE